MPRAGRCAAAWPSGAAQRVQVRVNRRGVRGSQVRTYSGGGRHGASNRNTALRVRARRERSGLLGEQRLWALAARVLHYRVHGRHPHHARRRRLPVPRPRIRLRLRAVSGEHLLVPQSADGAPNDSSVFQLAGGTLSAARLPAAQRLAGPSSPRATAVAFDAYRRGLARRQAAAGGVSPLVAAVRLSAAAAAPQPAGPPVLGSLRTFTVCANLTCSGTGGTKQVTAKVTTLGQHIAIYVDTAAPKAGLDSADLDTLKTVFDARLFPLDTAAFGQVTDVDTNGVVLVLMTGFVNSLVTSAVCKSSGFVAGFFLSADLDTSAAAGFNKGEIFYSIVADSAGTLSCVHSRTEVKRELGGTFTHELQHMINFGQHAILRPGTPEEGWLDEGLSKYAEELAGRSYLPGTA